MNQLDWNNLKYFLAVARSGGLTPAAVELETSASTVSRHIDAMEATLGARLFLRQQRGYLLTDAGSALLEQVREVERAMQAVERLGGAAAGLAGEVRVAAFESLAHFMLVPLLPQFYARYPQLRVELLVSRHLADLSRREADLALRIADPRRREHAPDYIAREVGVFHFGLYCTSALLAKSGGDLARLPFVSWDNAWMRLPMAERLAALFPGRQPVFRSNTVQAHLTAATSGLGAALLPSFIGDKDARLMKIPTDRLDTRQEIWLLYHRDLKGSGRVLAMRDFVLEFCGQALSQDG